MTGPDPLGVLAAELQRTDLTAAVSAAVVIAVGREMAADERERGREVIRLAEGIAEEITRAERASGYIRQSGAWGANTAKIAGIYDRHAAALRRVLRGPS